MKQSAKMRNFLSNVRIYFVLSPFDVAVEKFHVFMTIGQFSHLHSIRKFSKINDDENDNGILFICSNFLLFIPLECLFEIKKLITQFREFQCPAIFSFLCPFLINLAEFSLLSVNRRDLFLFCFYLILVEAIRISVGRPV